MFLQMVSLFLRKGASASAKDKKERLPIHWAAYLGEWCHSNDRQTILLYHLNKKATSMSLKLCDIVEGII